MPGRVAALASKEVRELLRERLVLVGMVIMPALIMILLGGLEGAAIHKTVEETGRPLHVAIVFKGAPTREDLALASLIAKATGFQLAGILQGSPLQLLSKGFDGVIVLEPGAASNISQGLPVSASIYVSTGSLGPSATSLYRRVEGALSRALQGVVAARVRAVLPHATPGFLSNPVRAEGVIVSWGREIPVEKYAGYLLSLYAAPLALLILITSATQVGAISIGLEREARTLEMLLASPVTSSEIVVSKILGVSAITLLGAASFGVGLAVYYKLAVRALGGLGLSIGVGLTAPHVAVAAIVVAASLYVAALLGLVLGLGAEDVRGAQMVANYLGFLLLAPYILVFLGLPLLPSGPSTALLLDPLYPPLPAVVGVYLSRPQLLFEALAAEAAHIVAWTLVAVKLLEPERLVAGIRLGFLLRGRRT